MIPCLFNSDNRNPKYNEKCEFLFCSERSEAQHKHLASSQNVCVECYLGTTIRLIVAGFKQIKHRCRVQSQMVNLFLANFIYSNQTFLKYTNFKKQIGG